MTQIIEYYNQEIKELNPFLFFIILIFTASYLIQLLYYLLFYLRIAIYRKKETAKKQEPVSIVICARNEADNLKKFLPDILTQDYPNYEVIVVNDCSSDESELLLNEFSAQYKHLYVTNIREDSKFEHGKKLALTIGIKAAKNEWLLLTDADCMVSSKNWLSAMQSNFTEKTKIVLGYGRYIKNPDEIFGVNKFIRYDTFFIAQQYLSFALVGVPYMGVGRNLAYRKSLFFDNKGFASHIDIVSGDDDLFINQHATKSITQIEIHPDSHTSSEPKNTFAEWFAQKKRHFTTSGRYKFIHKILLSLEITSRILLYLSFVILIFNKPFLVCILGAFGLRLVYVTVIFYFSMRRLKEADLLPYWLIFDIVLPFINTGIYMSNYFAKNRKWKR